MEWINLYYLYIWNLWNLLNLLNIKTKPSALQTPGLGVLCWGFVSGSRCSKIRDMGWAYWSYQTYTIYSFIYFIKIFAIIRKPGGIRSHLFSPPVPSRAKPKTKNNKINQKENLYNLTFAKKKWRETLIQVLKELTCCTHRQTGRTALTAARHTREALVFRLALVVVGVMLLLRTTILHSDLC